MIAPQKAWRRVPPDRASFPHPLVISYIRRVPLSSFSERHGKKISIGKWGGKGPSSGRSKAGVPLEGIMGDPESWSGEGEGRGRRNICIAGGMGAGRRGTGGRPVF